MYKKSNHILISVLLSTGILLCSLTVDISPKLFFQRSHRESQYVPEIHVQFQYPSWLQFYTTVEMFSIPLILIILITPVAYLSPTSRCSMVDTVTGNPGCNRYSIKVSLRLFMAFLDQTSAGYGTHSSTGCRC